MCPFSGARQQLLVAFNPAEMPAFVRAGAKENGLKSSEAATESNPYNVPEAVSFWGLGVSFLVLAVVSFLITKWLPAGLVALDFFSFSHFVENGHPRVKRATKLGCSTSMSFLCISAIAIAFIAFIPGNIEPSTFQALQPRAFVQAPDEVDQGSITVMVEPVGLSMDPCDPATSISFKSTNLFLTNSTTQACGAKAVCNDCKLQDISHISLVVPLSAQLVRWEVQYSYANDSTGQMSGSSSGYLTPQYLQRPSEVAYELIQGKIR
jgi:hypothetical protein